MGLISTFFPTFMEFFALVRWAGVPRGAGQKASPGRINVLPGLIFAVYFPLRRVCSRSFWIV